MPHPIHHHCRKIIHVDMDAFYASVEQRDAPKLKGRPVIVGGSPDSRGVVCACSYEARKFGVHSAMASSRAFRLCPQGVFLPPRFEAYEEVSRHIRRIFLEYSDLVEPLSLDEAYLDVTTNKKGMPSATLIAREIRERIRRETRLTASAGVSFSMFIAKAASDSKKPDGLTVVPPWEADAFISALPIGKFYGVGKVTEKRMGEFGILTGADLKKLTKEELVGLFGRSGAFFYDIARGVDDRQVEPNWIRKSVGRETTFETDTTDKAFVLETLRSLAESVEELLVEEGRKGRTLTLKIKYSDFTQITRSASTSERFSTAEEIMSRAGPLLAKTEVGTRQIRLVGLSVSSFEDEHQTLSQDDEPEMIQPLLPF